MEYDEYVVDLNADCKCGCMDCGRFHNIYHFPNDWGASVVDSPKKSGFIEGSYEILVIKFSCFEDFTPVNLPGTDAKVVECETWKDVVKTLTDIKEIKE